MSSNYLLCIHNYIRNTYTHTRLHVQYTNMPTYKHKHTQKHGTSVSEGHVELIRVDRERRLSPPIPVWSVQRFLTIRRDTASQRVSHTYVSTLQTLVASFQAKQAHGDGVTQ